MPRTAAVDAGRTRRTRTSHFPLRMCFVSPATSGRGTAGDPTCVESTPPRQDPPELLMAKTVHTWVTPPTRPNQPGSVCCWLIHHHKSANTHQHQSRNSKNNFYGLSLGVPMRHIRRNSRLSYQRVNFERNSHSKPGPLWRSLEGKSAGMDKAMTSPLDQLGVIYVAQR